MAELSSGTKNMIYTRNLAKLDPAKKALLFDTEDSTPDHLVFVVQDVATGALTIGGKRSQGTHQVIWLQSLVQRW